MILEPSISVKAPDNSNQESFKIKISATPTPMWVPDQLMDFDQ